MWCIAFVTKLHMYLILVFLCDRFFYFQKSSMGLMFLLVRDVNNHAIILCFWRKTAVKSLLAQQATPFLYHPMLQFSQSLKYPPLCLLRMSFFNIAEQTFRLHSFAFSSKCQVVFSVGFIAFSVVCIHHNLYLLSQVGLESVLSFPTVVIFQKW